MTKVQGPGNTITATAAGLVLLSLLLGQALAQTAAKSPAAARNYDVEEIQVDGNDVLTDDEIQDIIYPFLGPNRTATDIDAARNALAAVYKQRGYATISVTIPRQTVADGVVHLQVVERKIERLRVTGAQYFSPDDIKEHAPSLAEGQVPQMSQVQTELVALNQWQDRSITPSLRAGRAPNSVDVDLRVKDNLPLHASLSLNNRQSQNTTPLRVQTSISYTNLWQRGDVISFSGQVAPMRIADSNAAGVNYQYRLDDPMASLLLSYSFNGSDVKALGGAAVIGRGYDVGLRYVRNLGYTGNFSQSINAGLDFKHYGQLLDIGSAKTSTPIEYVPATLGWQGDWSGAKQSTSLGISAVLGIRGLGSGAGDFGAKRYDARPDYAYLKLDVVHLHALPWGMQISEHAQAQETPDPLISNEQFTIGGVDTVRGYLESEAVGDYGLGQQLELRLPNVLPKLTWLNQLRPFTFVDQGSVWSHDALPSVRSYYTLLSAGGGLRTQMLKTVSGEVIAAHDLTPGPDSRNGRTSVLFNVTGGF